MSVRAFGAALALCLSAVSSAAPKYTVRDFVDDPTYAAPALSPNGKYLAMAAPVNGRKRLVIIDIQSMKISQVATFGARTASSGDDVVSGYWWVSDERIVFTRSTYSGFYGGAGYTCEIYAMDADGGRRAQLWGSHVGSYSCGYVNDTMLDDDRYIAIDASSGGSSTNFGKPSIYKTDVITGETRNIGTSAADNGDLVTDRAGKPRLALGFNDKTLAPQLFWRHPDKIEWVDLSALIKDDDQAYIVGFAPDQRNFYIVSDEPKSSTDALWLVDPIAKTKTMVAHDPRADIDATYRDYDRNVYALQYMPDFPERKYVDPKNPLARLTASVEASFPDDMVTVNSISKDGKVATVVVWSDRTPGDVYLLDVPNMKLKYAFSFYPKLKAKDLAQREPVRFKARDGLTIPAYLTLPPGRSKGLPLIVLPHGGPHGPYDKWDYDFEPQLFAHHGYAVLQVNFRGSGGYGRDYEESGYKKWGREMQDDLTDATRWAVAQGYADANRLCIYGASYGGYAALMGVAREPDLYKCAVGYVGVYDLPLMLETGNVAGSLWGMDYLKRAIGSDMADAYQRSPIAHIEKIKADLFLVHGEQDRQAHYENYIRLTRALDKIGKKYEALTKEKEQHGFGEVENRVELYTRMLAFLQRNIGGADTSLPLPDNPPPAK